MSLKANTLEDNRRLGELIADSQHSITEFKDTIRDNVHTLVTLTNIGQAEFKGHITDLSGIGSSTKVKYKQWFDLYQVDNTVTLTNSNNLSKAQVKTTERANIHKILYARNKNYSFSVIAKYLAVDTNEEIIEDFKDIANKWKVKFDREHKLRLAELTELTELRAYKKAVKGVK